MEAVRSVVLIVEDDPVIQQVVTELLAAEGYDVERASDGIDGLARIQAGGVDLVLLDWMLPGLDGVEVCRRVRMLDLGAYLPIIMLTAISGETQEHIGFAAGADDYVVKPFRLRDLLDRVQVWLRARHRFKVAHERLLGEQQRLRWLEQQTLREQLARDEAVLAMARTASDQLNQPLAALLGWVELWETDESLQDDPSTLREKIKTAAEHLAERIHALTHTVRYAPAEVAGYIHLDVASAQQQEPQADD